MQTPSEQPTWIRLSGEAFCTDHAGQYLSSAAKTDPAATEPQTPTNHWIDATFTGLPTNSPSNPASLVLHFMQFMYRVLKH